MKNRILIAGSGYVGSRLAQRLQSAGHHVWTLRRRPEPGNPTALAADLTRPERIPLPDGLTHVVFCAGLSRAEPEAYRALLVEGQMRLIHQLKDHPVKRYCFTSTTGVFGQTDGSWVDETTPPAPGRPAARYYLQAEEQICAAYLSLAFVARLSGIYGPGRTRLIRSVQEQTARRQEGQARYLNHVHVDDITGALAHLLFGAPPHTHYLITDNEPADRNQVLTWLAARLKVPVPPFDTALSPGRGGNKRCSNARLRKSGYQLQFPTYREGYNAMITA